MSVPGGWQFVAYQLDAEQRLFGYRFAPRDDWNRTATDQLAQTLFTSGVPDVRELALYIGAEARRELIGQTDCDAGGESGVVWCGTQVYGDVSHPVAYLYNKRTNARVEGFGNVPDACVQRNDGEQGNTWVECPPIPLPVGPIDYTRVLLPDRHRVDFSVRFVGPDAVAVFIPKLWQEDSGWQSFGEALAMFVGIASIAVPGLGAAIGSYVFGAEFAVAYPAVVSVATNTAFNAVLGGADIEHAVGRALATYAGGVAGGFAGAEFDSALMGRLTAAATVATLNGRDVGQAVGVALLQSGASSLTNQPVPSSAPFVGVSMDESEFFDVPAGTFVDMSGDPMFDSTGQPLDMSGDPMFDPNANVPSNVPILSPTEVAAGSGWNDALAKVSQTALTALQIYKVYQSANSPAPKAGLPSQVVNKNGTITNHAPSGAVSTTKPAPGQPYVAADGTLVMNNGDGTYTLVSPNGARQTLRYPDGTGGALVPFAMSPDTKKWLLYGGLGLGVLWWLSRSRRA